MRTPDSRLVRVTLGLFFILLIGYALFEAQGIFFGPEINVPQHAITVNEAFTTIKGRAERITELKLNGATIPVTESGEFEEPYLLAKGSNRLILEARDARGRKTQTVLTVVYLARPAADSTPSTTVPLAP